MVLQGLFDATGLALLNHYDLLQCLMMVFFQRKIIYMGESHESRSFNRPTKLNRIMLGYIPPGTRQERLSDLPNLSTLQKDYQLEETRIESSDNTLLSTLVMARKGTERPDCVIFYSQGNADSFTSSL